jgi:putative ABC transport system permease protein
MLSILRTFSRNPGSTALCVLSLAAGIGLTAALASVADAILYRPLPVPRPEQIVRIFTSSAEQPRGFVSFRDFEDYRSRSRTVVAMTAQTQVLVAVGGDAGSASAAASGNPAAAAGGIPSKIRLGLAVTADYFDALRVPPAIGRGFRADEWRQPVVVLSDAFWRSEYGAERRIIGRAIRLGGVPFTVLGIARKNFGLDRFVHESFYVPMGVYESGILASNGHPLEDRGRRFLMVYGRLAPGGIRGVDHGVSCDAAVQGPSKIDEARAEFSTLAARLEDEYPETNRRRRAMVVTELEARMGADGTLPALAALLIALAALILAIASANAGGVLLGRAEARAKEIAVRMALGATHGHLLFASIRDAGLLALAGAAVGVPVAWAATKLLARVVALPTDFPFAIEPRMDARVVLVAMVASAVAAIVCGCAPVLAARRVEISSALKSASENIAFPTSLVRRLKGGGRQDCLPHILAGDKIARPTKSAGDGIPRATHRGTWRIGRRGTWRGALAAVEVALATALMATGAWLLESVRAVDRIDPGYRVDGVLTMALDPAQTGYTRAATRAFYDQLLRRVRTLPGVKNAALAQSVVLGYTRSPAQVHIENEIEGRLENDREGEAAGGAERGQTAHGAHGPARSNGLTTMWMNTVTPEYFALMRLPLVAGRGFDDRDTESSPAVAIVNQELAKRCGVGTRIRVNGRMVEVVGVARTAKYFDIHETPQPHLYLPYAQNYASRMVLHIETGTQTKVCATDSELARSPLPPSTLAGGEAPGDIRREIAGDSSCGGRAVTPTLVPAPVDVSVLTAVLREIRAMDAGQPVSEIRPLRDYLEQGAMLGARVGVDAISGVGACAMALALAGICGVISQAVRRRRREIGIRIALGATRSSVVGIVMRRAIVAIALGTGSGLAAAAAATRLLAAVAPGTGGIEFWSASGSWPAGIWPASAAAAVAIAGLAAALIPAWPASAIDPVQAFRCE